MGADRGAGPPGRARDGRQLIDARAIPILVRRRLDLPPAARGRARLARPRRTGRYHPREADEHNNGAKQPDGMCPAYPRPRPAALSPDLTRSRRLSHSSTLHPAPGRAGGCAIYGAPGQVAGDRRTPNGVIVRAGQAPGQGYNVSSPAVRRAAAQDQDSSGNGDLPRPAPQACSITDSDPKELAFKIVRGFARSNDISGAVGPGFTAPSRRCSSTASRRSTSRRPCPPGWSPASHPTHCPSSCSPRPKRRPRREHPPVPRRRQRPVRRASWPGLRPRSQRAGLRIRARSRRPPSPARRGHRTRRG